MRVIPIISAVVSDDGMRSLTPGEVVDLPEPVAERLIAGGIAEPVVDELRQTLDAARRDGKRLFYLAER